MQMEVAAFLRAALLVAKILRFYSVLPMLYLLLQPAPQENQLEPHLEAVETRIFKNRGGA